MLTVNKCQEAFWLGNLRNRNLQVGVTGETSFTYGGGTNRKSFRPLTTVFPGTWGPGGGGGQLTLLHFPYFCT